MSHLLWYPGHELWLRDIVRAFNCDLYDSAGRRYVDLESGVWCTAIGHAHPAVLRVLAEQSQRIAHTGYNYSCAAVEEAAREILALAGLGEGRCVFLCSGSEAVEYGVRVARMATSRPRFLTMTDSYFGAYGSAAARRSEEWFSFDWSTACATRCARERDPGAADAEKAGPTEQRKADPSEAATDAGHCGPDCPHWNAIPWGEIGGFLFEPGSSSGLVRFPPRALIRAIAAKVRQDGGWILVNEVTTGIGRTGMWFGHQHYGISPYVVAMGKGLGNGYPVAAAVFSPELIAALEGREVKYSQSHQNDPLGAAVAREVVRVIGQERLVERGREIGAMLMQGLEQIRRGRERIAQVRGRGLMIAVELCDDADASFSTRVHRALLQRGYLVARRPGLNVLRIDPPLTVDRADVEGFLRAFDQVLAEV